MGVYTAGTAVTITETFKILNVPTDPTTVTFTVQDPGGVDTSYVFGVDPEVTNPDVGDYVLQLPALTQPGIYYYTVVGTGAVEASGGGDFTIIASPVVDPTATWAVDGPCQPWCDSNDVWVGCGQPMTTIGAGSLEEECPLDMTKYAQMASWLLWELSGRLHSGRCIQTVRPCSSRPCGFQVLSKGHIVWPYDFYYGYPGWGWNGSSWWYGNRAGCGCVPLDRIQLAGYPVREIIEVKIDGAVIPEADNWRLDRRRFLTRMADANGDAQRWPACQRLDEEDTEPGTFSVTYAYGQDAPLLGQLAAAQVACEFYKAETGGECKLPNGTVRITRQGVTVDKLAALGWFRTSDRGWTTGIPTVDAFLNGINPRGLTRRPMIMAPGQRYPRYAQPVGQ
jgi:hypothetical protein